MLAQPRGEERVRVDELDAPLGRARVDRLADGRVERGDVHAIADGPKILAEGRQR